MNNTIRIFSSIFLFALLLPGCDYSNERVLNVPSPVLTSATIVPGINPAFATVTETAVSTSAGDAYVAVSDATYDAATETLTLGPGSIPSGGAYVRISGDATIGGATSSYTIYTHVSSNVSRIAANELTSLAVGYVAEGVSGNFNSAVTRVAAATNGVSSADVTRASKEGERSETLQVSLFAIANEFENGAFVPGTSDSSAINAGIWQCVEFGGLVWDNMSKVDAGGSGALPAGETNSDYQRCKSCHGWDRMGTDGGYARRSRKSSRPNAGFQDPNQVSRNVSGGNIDLATVLQAGTGRSYAEGSAVFDGTDPWGPGTQKGNEHPDMSSTGVNAGYASARQTRCVTAFLNHPDARVSQIFGAIDPTPAEKPEWCISSQCADYIIVGSADAARGEAWYYAANGGNCVTCHGDPDDEVGPIADGPDGGLLNFLRQDGKHSEFAHKVRWGEAGDDLMTRANMNNPTAANVADLLAYMQGRIEEAADLESISLGGVAYDNMSKMDAGGTGALPAGEPSKDYQRCKSCHGWDRRGTDGGYARRSRNSGRPNAGLGDPNTVSRNIDGMIVSEDMVLHAGTGRSWFEGSMVFDFTSPTWGPGAQLGNTHPDLSMGGANGTDVPSAAQIQGLVDFLNFPGGRADAVFAEIIPNPDPVPSWCISSQCADYTLVPTADVARGDAWYHDPSGGACVICHGEPEDEVGPIAEGPEGGLLHFLRQDGKYSEYRHKVQWGQAGDDLMTRRNMNYPTAAQVADSLAYLQDEIRQQELALIALGGLAYDNMSLVDAGGTGVLPAGETNKDYQRCKSCHGWDRMGTDGGYARRSRTSSRPNAGFGDPNTVSRNFTDLEVTADMVLHAGTGRSWAEGSAVFDMTSPQWGAGAQLGNTHPDLSMGGVNGTDVPSDMQIAGLVEFLNYEDGRTDAVFSAINPNPNPVPEWCTSSQCTDYTLVETADASRGDSWYHDPNGGACVVCHGEPQDAVGPITDGPEGGLLNFLRQDGKYSEYRHKVQWGQAGDDLMTRENMGNPTAAEIADSLAYLNVLINAQVLGLPFATNDTASTDQDTAVQIDVLNNDSDPNNLPLTVTGFDSASANSGTVSCTNAGICTYTPANGFVGSDTFDYTVSNGKHTADATVTVTVNSTGGGSDDSVARGQALYDDDCSSCHAAGSHDTTTALGGTDMGGIGAELISEGRLINDLETIDPIMNNLVLTDQQILDMAAFLDSL